MILFVKNKMSFSGFSAVFNLFFLWLVLAGFSGEAQAAGASLTPPDIEKVIARNELVVAIPAFDSQPFYFTRNGELKGFDVELARSIAASLKVPVRFNRVAQSFDELVDIVARGDADLALGKLSRTTSRVQRVRFSQPYVIFHHALAINRVELAKMSKGRGMDALIRDFQGSIGVLRKSSFVEFAHENFPKARVVEMADWSSALSALRKGEVTAVYRDEFEIKRLLKKDPAAALTLRTVTLTDTVDSIGVALNPSSRQLLALVDLYLAQRTDQHTADSILKQWKDDL